MGEVNERIYCCDRGNDNALAAAIMSSNRRDNNDGLYALLANRNGDMSSMLPAMMAGGMNGMNNPFAWIVLLAMMRNGGLFGGDGNAQGIELQQQIDSLRTQLSDNHNSSLLNQGLKGNESAIRELASTTNCNYNSLSQAICDVRAALQQVGGQVGASREAVINAILAGKSDVIQAVQNCCCNVREGIADLKSSLQLQMCQDTGAIQRGQDFINRSVERGFSESGFNAERNKCDIINAINAAQQRTSDQLNNHWSNERERLIQDLKGEISQLKQTDRILSRMGYRNNCGGCNDNYGF